MTPYEQIGGETGLRAIIDEFVDGCFDDVMIGFLFRNAQRERVKKFEFQHAAAQLGSGIRYEGRPIRAAHGPHPIMGGHFDRRLTILRQTLTKHAVPQAIIDAWVEHHQSLRAQVTADVDSNCNHDAAEKKVRGFS